MNYNLTIYKKKTSGKFPWNSIDRYIHDENAVETGKDNQFNHHEDSDICDKYLASTEKSNQGNHHEYSGLHLDSTQTTAESSLASSRQTTWQEKDEDSKNTSSEFAEDFFKSLENNNDCQSEDEQKKNFDDFFGFQQPSYSIPEHAHEQFDTQGNQTIEMDSFTEFENIFQQKPNQKIDCVYLHKTIQAKTKKSYEHKNVLKILGQKMISMIFDNYYESKKKNTLEEFLIQIQDDVAGEINHREHFIGSITEFKKYLKKEDIKKKYTKIKTFKEFWCASQSYENPEHEVYRRLLAKITRKFLEEDVYHILIQNKGPKPIKKEGKIFGYLQKVPILLRGMNDPEHFTNLDD